MYVTWHHSLCSTEWPRKPIWEFEITGEYAGIMGLLDFTPFEIGISEIMLEIGIWDFSSGITLHLKLGLQDYTQLPSNHILSVNI